MITSGTIGGSSQHIYAPRRFSIACAHSSINRRSFLGERRIARTFPSLPSRCLLRSKSRGTRQSGETAVCSAQAIRESPYRGERELDGVEKALGGIPKPAQLGGAVVGVLAAGVAGVLAGGRAAPADLQNVGKVAGGLAAGLLAALLVKNLEAKRATAASAELWNLLVNLGDPDQLQGEMVRAVGEKYGVDLNKRLLPDLSRIYDVYLQNLIPPGDKPLNGDEVERLVRFKGALGLSDEEAAPVHITVGQRMMRGRIEAPDRYSEAQERRTLQKLIYVSGLAFGEQKAAFLLPWSRVFNMTDAQLYVAKRDNARALFKQHLDQLGGTLPGDREGLVALRRVQQQVRLGDEEAEPEVKAAARAEVEKLLTGAVECIKKRTRVRDYSDAIRDTNALLAYNRRLISFAKDEGMPPGLGPVSVYGGKFESGPAARDMRDLYKVFVEERVRLDDGFSDQLADDVVDLAQILALGSKEADELRDEVVTKIYRRMLREAVTSGRLDQASSKAEVLNELCDNLQFDADAAAALHQSLYRQKLESLLEKKRLSDEDGVELERLRVLLCIPKDQIAAIHQDVCGRIYKMAVEEAMDVGFQRFQPQDRDRVRSVRQDVRLEPAQALQILDASARRRMLSFVTKARSQRNKLEGAKELKNLVYFSNIVIAPLVYDIKNAEKTAKQDIASQKIAELAKKAQAERAKADPSPANVSVDPTDVTIDVTAETVDESYTREEKRKAMKELLETDLEAAERKNALEQLEAAVVREDAKLAAERREAEKVLGEAAAEFEAKQKEQKAEERQEAEKVLDEAVKAEEKKEEGAEAEKPAEEGASSTEKPEKKEDARIKSQKDITLKADLQLRDRLDIYQNYLLYCVSGEVVEMPMGGSITVARDASEFERLQELGDVLGLTPMDTNSVRLDLAEKGFRQQVQEALADGNLTPDKVQRLNEIRDQLSLPNELAEQVIKGVQSQNLRKVIVAQDAMGTLNLQKLLDLKEQGIDVESLLSLDKRTDLYAKEMAAQLSAGTGDFDGERMLKGLPADLGLPDAKVQQVVERLAKDKKRTTLVQAISFLRQRKLDDATQALNNLIACNRALPSQQAADWSQREEIQDLYSIYIGREHSPEKQAEVRTILGVGEEEARRLADLVESGSFQLEEEAEEGALF